MPLGLKYFTQYVSTYVCPFEGVACTRGCGGGEDFVGEWPALYAEAEGGGKDVIGL